MATPRARQKASEFEGLGTKQTLMTANRARDKQRIMYRHGINPDNVVHSKHDIVAPAIDFGTGGWSAGSWPEFYESGFPWEIQG